MTWEGLPTLGVATDALWVLSQSINSARDFAGNARLPATSRGTDGSMATGSKSFETSYRSEQIAPLRTCVPRNPKLSVWPSGAARTTLPTPTVPAPPLTFSSTTGWPREWRIRSPMTRARKSSGPPAGNATIPVIGRDGKLCAIATPEGGARLLRAKITKTALRARMVVLLHCVTLATSIESLDRQGYRRIPYLALPT